MEYTVRVWLVCLVPRFVCRWLWRREAIALGDWAPYILGRCFNRDPKRKVLEE